MMLAALAKVLDGRLRGEQQTKNVDVELRWKDSSVTASIGANSYTPELLTRISSRPNFLIAASTMPCASAALETSPPTATALPPLPVISATTFSAPALLVA